jgi:hypothetical protein
MQASSKATSVIRSPLTPDSPTFPRHVKQLRPKAPKLEGKDSGYSVEAESEDHYTLVPGTPDLPYRNAWTPANTPRSVVDNRLPSPRVVLAGIAADVRKGDGSATDSSTSTNSPPISPRSRRVYPADEDYDGDSSAESSDGEAQAHDLCRKRNESPHHNDKKAAYLLMSLRMKKTDLKKTLRVMKRRAST